MPSVHYGFLVRLRAVNLKMVLLIKDDEAHSQMRQDVQEVYITFSIVKGLKQR
jgi:hypothetical protein